MMTERDLVEVMLEDPVHEDGVVSLPEGLVNEQLCLLGNVQLGNLASASASASALFSNVPKQYGSMCV